jgi:hypothetical protein
LLAATLAGLLFAWPGLSPGLRDDIRSLDGLKDRK